VVFIDSKGCVDSLEIVVGYISQDTLNYTLNLQQIDTFQINTDQLLGDLMITAGKSTSDEYAMLTIDQYSSYIVGEGVAEGNSETCIIVCDDYLICDTTYVFIKVIDSNKDLLSKQVIPQAIDDTKSLSANGNIIFNPMENDYLKGRIDTFYIFQNPSYGTANFDSAGNLEYIPSASYCDSQNPDVISYTICNEYGCDTANVDIFIACEELAIYNGFSPNGDGLNEFFYIEGLHQFPDNNLKIFSRWGAKIFEKTAYENDWNGIWKGDKLPEGTYFYVFEDGVGNTYSGPLQINK